MTLRENIDQKKPPLYGLVLAGGRSTRMGQDKGAMQWHGREQKYFMADMLKGFCDKVFISCRPEQQPEIASGYQTIADSVAGSGPLIAILSAFEQYPDVAWLVVACDLPLLNASVLQQLIENRDSGQIATTFKSPFDGLPEPLVTIWEPVSATIIENHFAEGYNCPRKALIKNIDNVNILDPLFPDVLLNTNTPEDAQKAAVIIAQKAKSASEAH